MAYKCIDPDNLVRFVVGNATCLKQVDVQIVRCASLPIFQAPNSQISQPPLLALHSLPLFISIQRRSVPSGACTSGSMHGSCHSFRLACKASIVKRAHGDLLAHPGVGASSHGSCLPRRLSDFCIPELRAVRVRRTCNM